VQISWPLRGLAFQQPEKLFAAERYSGSSPRKPCFRVRQRGAKPGRHLVPIGVVDRLEMVHIDHHHIQQGAVAPGFLLYRAKSFSTL